MEQGSVFRQINPRLSSPRFKVSIPLEQGSVFRHTYSVYEVIAMVSQSLWNRAVSSDEGILSTLTNDQCLNPFGTGQCLPTLKSVICVTLMASSQSLWNRAVSSDLFLVEWTRPHFFCLNPFGTGQCLPTTPCVTGGTGYAGLNPFGTGQCLPTILGCRLCLYAAVSIPLEQGSVFRLKFLMQVIVLYGSQSLWNRAVSSDF